MSEILVSLVQLISFLFAFGAMLYVLLTSIIAFGAIWIVCQLPEDTKKIIVFEVVHKTKL